MKGTPEIITVAIVCYLIGDSIGHVIKVNCRDLFNTENSLEASYLFMYMHLTSAISITFS